MDLSFSEEMEELPAPIPLPQRNTRRRELSSSPELHSGKTPVKRNKIGPKHPAKNQPLASMGTVGTPLASKTPNQVGQTATPQERLPQKNRLHVQPNASPRRRSRTYRHRRPHRRTSYRDVRCSLRTSGRVGRFRKSNWTRTCWSLPIPMDGHWHTGRRPTGGLHRIAAGSCRTSSTSCSMDPCRHTSGR